MNTKLYVGNLPFDVTENDLRDLFGGFGPRVFAAYHEAFPLSPGHEARVPLYQLYFLIAHVNLFGGSYVASVEHALAELAHPNLATRQ